MVKSSFLSTGMLNEKKFISKTRTLCPVVTKNSNWEIFSKNLVAFKR